MITEVTHKFSGGQFKQLLKCIKNQKEPNHPVYADDDNESEDQAQAEVLEAPAVIDPRQEQPQAGGEQPQAGGEQPQADTNQDVDNVVNYISSIRSGSRFR